MHRNADVLIAGMATAEKGLITRRALLAEGVTDDQIRTRLERGSLLAHHRGVYRVGHEAPSVDATYLAAVRACGRGAWLCGAAAGYIWRALKGAAPTPEVTAPTKRHIPGVVTHRWRRMHPDDTAVRNGIPVTSLARTIVDLAAVLSLDALAQACHEAGVLYDLTPGQVRAVLERRPNAKGAGKLRRVLEGDAPVLLSKLERRFRALLRQNGLPLPVTNRRAGGRRVDCRWAKERLTVELDSYTYHRSRHAWERDRRREREARARGDEFVRYTYGDVFDRPEVVIRELSSLLPITPSRAPARPRARARARAPRPLSSPGGR